MPQIKKAILTGGGRATRLRPITATLNKHLIPLANQPMIFHAIAKVVEAGVTEIFINTNPGEDQLPQAVGDGSRWGVKIQYFEQTGGPQGIAHVVKCAEKFIGREPFIFYLSDNIVLGSLKAQVRKFFDEKLDCLLALAKVSDPQRFGVPRFDETGQLVEVLEKPEFPPSDFAVTGIYFYQPCFFEAFDHIQKSPRGEYEISDIHSYFLRQGFKVGFSEITGWWKDTGKPEDLILASSLLLQEQPAEFYRQETVLPAGVSCEGLIKIGQGVSFGESVVIRGPAVIGDNCLLENCTINPFTTIGAGSVVKNTTLSNSIILDNCRLEAPIKISDSILGKGVTVIQDRHTDFHRLILGDQTLVEI